MLNIENSGPRPHGSGRRDGDLTKKVIALREQVIRLTEDVGQMEIHCNGRAT